MARRRHGDERRSMLIPLSYAAAAVVAGMVLPRLETHYLPQSHALVNPDAAMAILSAIASGMMALTGIVFSLAFVMVQFSATAYSPRLVLWLARSPVINHSIGVFTATFLYAIAALAWIDRSGITPVPFYTVWVGVLLLLVSVVFFVRLVERVGMLQIGRVLAFIGNQGREIVATLYQPLRPLPGSGGPAAGAVPDLGPVVQEVRHEGAPAAVEALDVPLLEELAGRGEAVIAVAVGVGYTVMDGIPLFRVHGGKALSQARPRDAVLLGRERTFEQDPKYALRLLVDVGIKALSPAINDPTTAVQALDQIGDPAAAARTERPRRGPPDGCLGTPPGDDARPHLGGLPRPGHRRDPLLRRHLGPGDAPPPGSAPGPVGSASAASPGGGVHSPLARGPHHRAALRRRRRRPGCPDQRPPGPGAVPHRPGGMSALSGRRP
jgi:uncharacterized membrane protein